jgi:hypothetical protein
MPVPETGTLKEGVAASLAKVKVPALVDALVGEKLSVNE